MKHRCSEYTLEQISRFVDKELPPDSYQAMAGHCRDCSECKKTIKTLSQISTVFQAHVAQESAAINNTMAEPAAPENLPPKGFTTVFGALGQHLFLKLGFITAVLVAGIFVYNTQFAPPQGPSAIVKYVDTEMPSVMIFETEKQKHTIIWISET